MFVSRKEFEALESKVEALDNEIEGLRRHQRMIIGDYKPLEFKTTMKYSKFLETIVPDCETVDRNKYIAIYEAIRMILDHLNLTFVQIEPEIKLVEKEKENGK